MKITSEYHRPSKNSSGVGIVRIYVEDNQGNNINNNQDISFIVSDENDMIAVSTEANKIVFTLPEILPFFPSNPMAIELAEGEITGLIIGKGSTNLEIIIKDNDNLHYLIMEYNSVATVTNKRWQDPNPIWLKLVEGSKIFCNPYLYVSLEGYSFPNIASITMERELVKIDHTLSVSNFPIGIWEPVEYVP